MRAVLGRDYSTQSSIERLDQAEREVWLTMRRTMETKVLRCLDVCREGKESVVTTLMYFVLCNFS